jgi:D-aspartate ligase
VHFHVVVAEPTAGGLAIARRLVRDRIGVTLIDEPERSTALSTRGVSTVQTPFGEDGAAWLEALATLAGAHEQLLVIPTMDRSCELIVRTGESLPANVLAFERGSERHLPLMNKETANAIALQAGVPVPAHASVENLDSIDDALANATWPSIVRPVLSHRWRARYGEVRTVAVANAAEARELLRRSVALGYAMQICELVPGGDEDVEEAIVLRLADGSYPIRFGCRKLRQWPPGFGTTTLGESSPMPTTMSIATRVLDAAGFVGVAGIEVKRNCHTGERWFLEANVRVPGQWGLGDACGAEATMRLIAALRGLPLDDAPVARAGVRFAVPDLDVLVIRPAIAASPVLRRPLLVAHALRSYRRVREIGIFDLRDPGPLCAYAGDRVSRMLRQALKRLRRRGRIAGHDQ